MTFDHQFEAFRDVRAKVSMLTHPLMRLANAPKNILNDLEQEWSSHQTLMAENQRLTSRLVELEFRTQRYELLQAEMQRIRALLGATKKMPEKQVLVAELIGVDPAPYSHVITIDRGSQDDVVVGQALVDEFGLMGQVIEVGWSTSRVLLITDTRHAIPVLNLTTGDRFIAAGTGRLDSLTLEQVPDTVVIEVGDLIVSSGLGERFPPGYPVGRVSSVSHESGKDFAEVIIRPHARLNKSRLVLLIQPNSEFQNTAEGNDSAEDQGENASDSTQQNGMLQAKRIDRNLVGLPAPP